MPRVIFVDKLIRSAGGHNLETNLRLIGAFAAEGYETHIVGNSRFKGDRPPNFHPDLDFDFDRIVLSADQKRLAKTLSARKKLRRQIGFLEGIRSFPLGRALVQLNEIKAGRDTLDKRVKSPISLLSIIIARLFTMVMIIVLMAITWPVRYSLFKIYNSGPRGVSRKFKWFFVSKRNQLRDRVTRISELRLLHTFATKNLARIKNEDTYERSLRRSLNALRLRPDDIVFFSTASVSELESVARVVQSGRNLGIASWHFLFREPIFPAKGSAFIVPSSVRPLRGAVMEIVRLVPKHQFWTDTHELAEQYSYLGLTRFGALPIALPDIPEERLKEQAQDSPPKRLTIGYLGDARPEKGYGVLPKLIKELSWKAKPWMDATARARRIKRRDFEFNLSTDDNNVRNRFLSTIRARTHAREIPLSDPFTQALYEAAPSFGGLIQSNFNVVGGTSVTRASRYRLMAQDDLGVTVFTKPLKSDAYVDALLKCDLFVLFYTSWLYSAGSSGIFAEALAAGKPIIVSDATWGGRILRTRPEYIKHINMLMQDYSVRTTDISDKEVAIGKTFWRATPKNITHLVFMARILAARNFDQIELTFEFMLSDRSVYQTTRRLCDREQGAGGVVRIPLNAKLFRVHVERLDSKLLPNDIEISLGELNITGKQFVPLSAIGHVVANEDELLPAALDIGAHYPHYSRSSIAASHTWRQLNNSNAFAQAALRGTKIG